MIEAAPPGLTCPCVRQHSPPAFVVEVHHALPLSWGGQDVDANRVRVCCQCHYSAHAILNMYVRLGGEPPRSMLKGTTRLARQLAARAWAERIPGHPTPYW